MKYRINKEINDLIQKFKTVNVEYNFEKNHIHITVDSKIMIEFFITNDYPFKPPIVMINKKPYDEFIMCKSSRIMHMIYCNEGFCPCCDSILMEKKKWYPLCFLETILNEIDKIRIIKNKIKYHLALKYIFDKINLPSDLERIISGYLVA
jgi:ubiquitin-protein ligase